MFRGIFITLNSLPGWEECRSEMNPYPKLTLACISVVLLTEEYFLVFVSPHPFSNKNIQFVFCSDVCLDLDVM